MLELNIDSIIKKFIFDSNHEISILHYDISKTIYDKTSPYWTTHSHARLPTTKRTKRGHTLPNSPMQEKTGSCRNI